MALPLRLRAAGIIGNTNKKGTTVLLVTHDSNIAVHADKVIYLEDGRIMDTLNLGKYVEGDAASRDAEMKNWLKKDESLIRLRKKWSPP